MGAETKNVGNEQVPSTVKVPDWLPKDKKSLGTQLGEAVSGMEPQYFDLAQLSARIKEIRGMKGKVPDTTYQRILQPYQDVLSNRNDFFVYDSQDLNSLKELGLQGIDWAQLQNDLDAAKRNPNADRVFGLRVSRQSNGTFTTKGEWWGGKFAYNSTSFVVPVSNLPTDRDFTDAVRDQQYQQVAQQYQQVAQQLAKNGSPEIKAGVTRATASKDAGTNQTGAVTVQASLDLRSKVLSLAPQDIAGNIVSTMSASDRKVMAKIIGQYPELQIRDKKGRLDIAQIQEKIEKYAPNRDISKGLSWNIWNDGWLGKGTLMALQAYEKDHPVTPPKTHNDVPPLTT